jgi:ankyrin repeat protein
MIIPHHTMMDERSHVLLDSCRKGDLEKVWHLLEEADGEVSIHARDEEYSTCLHSASQNGHDDLIRVLVANGAGVDEVNRHGNTPLHLASLQPGRTDTVRLLLSLGANVHAPNLGQQTPLLLASFFGCTETVRVLAQEAGASVNHVADHGLTALHLAASSSDKGKHHSDTVQLLLQLSANANAKTQNTEWTALNFAIQRNAVETVRILIQDSTNANVNTRDASNATPLHFASLEGYTETAKLLLADSRTNVNARDKTGRTPLHTGKHTLAFCFPISSKEYL